MAATQRISSETPVSDSAAARSNPVASASRSAQMSTFHYHVRAWIEQVTRFMAGLAITWLLFNMLLQPDLEFLAALSAGFALLYIANLADVERYRDAIAFTVPALFIWLVLAFDFHNAALVGLTLFTHLFMAFFGSFVRTTGGLSDLRLWSLLLGVYLASLIYLVMTFLA
jgi:hypothetical protein